MIGLDGPASVSLDVSLHMPAEDPLPSQEVVPTQRLYSADTIDVTAGCTGAW